MDTLDPTWKHAFAEVERMIGGSIVSAERQKRWRPAWFLEVDCEDDLAAVYFRGDRGLGQDGVYNLEHEFAVLKTLAAQGIPVPHVYGFCEEPRGIVMERCPGRANLATAESDEERRSVLDHYIEILVDIHALDTAPFEHAGLYRPRNAEEIGRGDLAVWEQSYRNNKNRPEPLIEFVLRWLGRNVPTHRTQVSLITGDCGQFVFDRGRVTGVLDLELAMLGDPLADLAAMRCRDTSEPLGDLSRAYRRYQDLTARPIDMAVLHYHTIRFALNTPLAVAYLCAQPMPGLDLAQYLGWYLVFGRIPLEVIAELGGIEVTAPDPIDAAISRESEAQDMIVASLAAAAEKYYEQDAAYRVSQYLREIDRYGARRETEDLEEIAALLERPVRTLSDWRVADTALEQYVLEAGPDKDADILRYLYRRTLRRESLLAPAMRELENTNMQTIRL
jgi:aminoglycoside phosphotransferase